MRYIDFTVQTLLILLGIFLLLLNMSYGEWPFSLLIVQMFLGPWQVFSSISGVVARGAAHKAKRFHLVASVLYFLVMVFANGIASTLGYQWSDATIMSYLIIPPWILALFYYRITWRIAFPNYKKNSNFLPHINF